MPLPPLVLPLVPLGAPPLVGIPPPPPALPPALGIPLPLPILEGGADASSLEDAPGFLLLGGFSTNEVSVVRNVASTSGTAGSCPLFAPPGPMEEEKSGWFWGRLKDSGAGVWRSGMSVHVCSQTCVVSGDMNRENGHTSGKSTQKAFMFMPYRKPAKLSEKRARLSCMSCSWTKLDSRSAIASESSAKSSCRSSRGDTEPGA
ncbi:hypothetical protein BU24DRAFT_171839 [Aaosphaeria arxii CBS 175.79]|uniref:Uncharacterized protein n=1 Tax=Aaosphaeria arxii CBS 175.79 TaxID=1450172 RepID=A0A6A5XYU0_9PLEO|nr:uncharacterized protein BU24DRAFT_171839 [Aaosphaeria arxii CBS 175.79]KAF2018485.1 hypothetical protein BU24DRAFT_171839 [Aaosphaeria arxii CBS 175.79]